MNDDTATLSTLSIDEIMNNQMISYEGKELINMEALDTIINNFEEIYNSRKIRMVDAFNNYTELAQDQILTILKKYRTNRRQGKRIKYGPSKNRQNGRLFSKQASGQGLSRPIRHTIFRDNYIDIDVVNCHPILLSWFCHKKKWQCEKLDIYIQNRDQILKDTMTSLQIEKDEAKNIFLKTLNGGELDKGIIYPPFIDEFASEMKAIVNNVVCETPPDEMATILKTKSYNLGGSILNRKLCCIENFVLKKIVEVLSLNGFDNLVLCFDGLMVFKRAEDQLPAIQTALDRLGIPNLKVKIKDMDEFIDLEPYINLAKLPLNPELDFDPNYTINEFELEFCGKSFSNMEDFKAQVIPKYCKVFAHFRDFNTPVYRCQDNKFKIGTPNTDLYHWVVGDKKVSIIDIPRLLPQYIPRYEDYDFYPEGFNMKNKPCPPKILNLWCGFKASRLDNYEEDKIKNILDHIRMVLADDDMVVYEYLLDWFAHIVQYPWKKTRVLILLYSRLQRAGKNSITEFFIHNILGTDISSDNLGIDVLTAKFNENLTQQIFTVCNELPQLTNTTRNSVFDTMKSSITDDTRNYEIKGGRKWIGPNYVNIIATTNHSFTYHIEKGDGRILPIECSSRFVGNFDYFNNLHDNLQQENADHFFTFLLERNITRNMTDIPMTNLKLEMIRQSSPSPVRFVEFLKEDDYEYLATDWVKDQKGIIGGSTLYARYSEWCRDMNENVLSNTAFGNILKKDCNINKIKKGVILYQLF